MHCVFVRQPHQQSQPAGTDSEAFQTCDQEKLRLKARQERFKDQLTKLPTSTTGNSKPTAAGASDIEAKKKVGHMLFSNSQQCCHWQDTSAE